MDSLDDFELELCRGVLRLPVAATPLRIGRGVQCELFLPDISVSELHATVYREDGHVYLRDENSLNRTQAGGLTLRLDTPRRLCGPQKLRFGRVHVLFNVRKKPMDLPEGQTANVALAIAREAIGDDSAGATFVVVQGEAQGQRIGVEYGQTITVGRSPRANLVLSDSSVSAIHIELRRAEHGYFVRDRGSTHGTMLGGKRLLENEWSLVEPGQTVGLGLAALTFEARADSAELHDAAEDLDEPPESFEPPAFQSLRPPVHDGNTERPPPPPPDPKAPPPSLPPPPPEIVAEQARQLATARAQQTARQRRDSRNFWVTLCIFAVLVGFAVAGAIWMLLP